MELWKVWSLDSFFFGMEEEAQKTGIALKSAPGIVPLLSQV
jgi:hypothetical protein